MTAMAPVREGVFFQSPAPLRSGRHGMSREDVQTAQRDRLLMAVTELLAARGYAGFSVADVARRAGVSLAAFYATYASKDACVFAGYDVFIGVLLTRLAELDRPHADRASLVRAVLQTYLGTLQSDLVVARAYQVEIDALGEPARRRRRDSLRVFAQFLQSLVDDRTDGEAPPEVPFSAYVGVVYAARQLASDALDEAAQPDLLALGEDLQAWMDRLFAPAQRTASARVSSSTASGSVSRSP